MYIQISFITILCLLLQDIFRSHTEDAIDWREKAISVHFTMPRYFFNMHNTVYEQQGVWGEMGRRILRAAGLLAQHKGLQP